MAYKPVKGPLDGCPNAKPHAWSECRRCKTAYMRRWRGLKSIARGKALTKR